jgi:hypothetical protein
MINSEKHYGNCDSSGSPCIEIEIQYPRIYETPNDSTKNTLNNFITKQAFQTVFEGRKIEGFDSLAEQMISSFKELRRKFPEAPGNWYLDREISVELNKNFILCLDVTETSFLGGAHPNTSKMFYNFDLRSGGKLKLSDLVIGDSIKVLTGTAEKIFRIDRKMNIGETYKEAGFWFKDDRFELNDNFAVTEDGILFYYNNYEIAPYVYGATKLLIPYDQVMGIIKKDGLLYKIALK